MSAEEIVMSTSNGPMQSTTTAGVIAIARDDSWAHMYQDVNNIRDLGDDGSVEDKEFFDSSGRRLAPRLGPAGRLQDLEETADDPDQDMVQQRLAAVVQHIRGYLESEQGKRFLEQDDLDHADLLPELLQQDRMSLEEWLAEFRALFGPHHRSPDDRRGPLHNLIAHGGHP